MIGALWWVIEHWWLVVWIAALVAAWRFGGWRLAAAVATLGLAWRLYATGREHGRREIERRERKRRQELEERYDEIDGRPRDPDDAYDRLHDRARRR